MIETERLILRPLTNDDALAIYKMDSDADVHRFLGNNPITNMEEARKSIAFINEQYKAHGIGRWAVTLKSTGEFMGWSGLKYITETTNSHIHYYDIGYRFIPQYWGNGYATESARAALNYGFEVLKAPEIIGIADTENFESIHVLEKLGLRRMEIFDYHGRDHYWMKIEKQVDQSPI